ncbi:MAG: WecB/TagA/CpsF family glycosyltransferase [Cyanobacteriota bacterium]|nr:WecB/TagA/CpsF family glycosyltransferase [Cyanobacteriota bacterium]
MLTQQRVLGVGIHIPDSEVASGVDTAGVYRDWLCHRIQAGLATHVVTCNAEMIMLARRDSLFADILATADLVTPDGAGVVWALARQGILIQRCPGIELAESLMQVAAQRNWRVALIGGKPEVAQAVERVWQQRYPNLSLWVHHGYGDAQQEQALVASLHDYAPHLLLVGMGSPRQEMWIRRQQPLLPPATWMGVGGSFDIWAGLKTRAPRWWRDHHLEWLYRLYQEPWRWRRMLALPHFAGRVLTADLWRHVHSS